jgi:hypothetical protein
LIDCRFMLISDSCCRRATGAVQAQILSNGAWRALLNK